MRLDLDLSGIQELADSLLGMDIDGASHEAVTEAGAVLLNRIRRRFLAQVDPEGVAWEPSYAAFRRAFRIGSDGKKLKRGAGGKTLFDTGTLFHSIQLYSVDPFEMSIASDVYYGVFHNEGTATLPKREFMGFSEEDEDVALKVLIKKVEEALQ